MCVMQRAGRRAEGVSRADKRHVTSRARISWSEARKPVTLRA